MSYSNDSPITVNTAFVSDNNDPPAIVGRLVRHENISSRRARISSKGGSSRKVWPDSRVGSSEGGNASRVDRPGTRQARRRLLNFNGGLNNTRVLLLGRSFWFALFAVRWGVEFVRGCRQAYRIGGTRANHITPLGISPSTVSLGKCRVTSVSGPSKSIHQKGNCVPAWYISIVYDAIG